MDKIKTWRPGILSPEQLNYLSENDFIRNCDPTKECAIDLHLGGLGWQMKGSIRHLEGEDIVSLTSKSSYRETLLDLSEKRILHPKNTYIFQLREELRLSDTEGHFHGRATGKSSIGRLDVLTRLMANGSVQYDIIKENETGPLYVEVTPMTFPIIVEEGVSLNQLRLFRGHPDMSLLGEKEIELYGDVLIGGSKGSDKLGLSLNLTPVDIEGKEAVAFTQSRDSFDHEQYAIDLTSAGLDTKSNPHEFWKVVQPNDPLYIEIKNGRFYILRSTERFKLPKDLGVYCQAITENLGEIRIHYAGFVHPGFGLQRDDGKGAPLIFEVRGHGIDAFLRHEELMAKLLFYRTSEPVDIKPSPYDDQELKLSKYFAEWNH